MARLKAWCIDKHKLRGAYRSDARDTVARGLRLALGNADFLPDQSVKQRRLPDIGSSDDGNRATPCWTIHHVRCRVDITVFCTTPHLTQHAI